MKYEENVLTKRYCLDIGRGCNAKCKFCYYANTPMVGFKSLYDIKIELKTAIEQGNNELEYTGGEPTICPHILETIEYAKKIGFRSQRIITNGLASTQQFKKMVDKGCRQFLLSLHGYGDTLNGLTQVPTSWKKMNETIATLKELDVQLFGNITMLKQNKDELLKVTKFCVEHGFSGINYINWNEHYSSQAESKKEHEFQEKVSILAPKLMRAIDYAVEHKLWVNVRYFPMCLVDEKYRKYIVNNPIYLFDDLEWAPKDVLKNNDNYQKYNRNLQFQINDNANEKCSVCGIRNVCGAVNKAYSVSNGVDELTVQEDMIDYPMHYRRELYHMHIGIVMYKMNKDITTLLAEVMTKTTPPYTLHLIHAFDSAARNRNRLLDASSILTTPQTKLVNKSQQSFLAMMDDDIFNLPFNWNRRLLDNLKYNPEVNVVSARLFNEDGSLGANSANNFDVGSRQVQVNMVPTACCVFRWDHKTRFDEKMISAGWEDTKFFTELGGKILIDNMVQVVHANQEREGGGANNDYNREVFEEFMKKKLLKNKKPVENNRLSIASSVDK